MVMICTCGMLDLMQSSWLSEEEFGMGLLDLKQGPAKIVPGK